MATKREGGRSSEVLPLQKKGGGESFSHPKGGGGDRKGFHPPKGGMRKTFNPVLRGGGRKKFRTRAFPIL